MPKQSLYTGNTAATGANPVSARSAYPVFLSVQETSLLQLKAASKGLLDAFRWDVVVRLMIRYEMSSSAMTTTIIESNR